MVAASIGLALALGAAALYAAGIGLQAAEARDAPREQALRFGLFWRLVRRPVWVAGTGLGLAGWILQALALSYAPLTLVQPALALSLVLLLAGAAWLREPVRRRDWVAVSAVVAGVAVLVWAAPRRAASHAEGALLWLPLALLAVVALAPYLRRRRRRTLGTLVVVSAGVAYALDGVTTKLASDAYAGRTWLPFLAWFCAMGVASGVATLSEMSALQTQAVTKVAPVVFALTTFVPVALAPSLADESWPSDPARVAALVTALLLVGAGALVLVRAAPLRKAADPHRRRAPQPAGPAPARGLPARAD